MSRRICENQRDVTRKRIIGIMRITLGITMEMRGEIKTYNDTHKHHYKNFAFYCGIKPFVTKGLFPGPGVQRPRALAGRGPFFYGMGVYINIWFIGGIYNKI